MDTQPGRYLIHCEIVGKIALTFDNFRVLMAASMQVKTPIFITPAASFADTAAGLSLSNDCST